MIEHRLNFNTESDQESEHIFQFPGTWFPYLAQSEIVQAALLKLSDQEISWQDFESFMWAFIEIMRTK